MESNLRISGCLPETVENIDHCRVPWQRDAGFPPANLQRRQRPSTQRLLLRCRAKNGLKADKGSSGGWGEGAGRELCPGHLLPVVDQLPAEAFRKADLELRQYKYSE